MANNATIKVEVLADPANFERGMDRTAKATESIGQKLGTFAKVAVAALALKALGAVKDFAGDAVRAFSELEQSTGGVEAVFGDQAERIKKWSKAAADNLGLSEAAANQASTTIGAMLQNYGFSAEEAATKSMELIAMGSDLAAMFGGTVNDAVSAIGAALRGETESIEKYGVSMNATKVQAHALEMGLADTTAELTDQNKAMAALDLLADQTKTSVGQFGREADTVAGKQERLNAELENQKALLGQALIPLQSTWSGIQSAAIPIIADLAIEVGKFTGALTDAQATLLSFQTDNQRALETAKEFIEAFGEDEGHAISKWLGDVFDLAHPDSWVDKMQEGIQTAGLTVEALDDLGRELEKLRDRGEITEEQFTELNGTLEHQKYVQEQLDRPISDNERALYGLSEASEDAAAEQAGLADDTEEATSALQEFEDEVRSQIDPLYALVSAHNDVASAQQDVIDAEEEFGKGSPEYIAATLALAQEFDDLKAAQLRVAEQSDMTESEFRRHLQNMGTLSQEQIDIIIGEFRRVDAFTFADKFINIRANDIVTGRHPGKAGGGRVQEGSPVVVGESGRELFIPDSSGDIIPNHRLNGSSGGGTTINFNISPQPFTDPNANAKAIVEYLDRYRRNNGRFPWE